MKTKRTRRIVICYILSQCTVLALFSQSMPTTIGAPMAGIGYASAATSNEWSLFNNFAGITGNKMTSVAFACEVNPALSGAGRAAAVVNVPLKRVTVGAGVFRFGDELYSEQTLSGAIGSKIGNTSLGAKLNLVQYRAENFGTQSTGSIDVGGITELTPRVSIGAYIVNITQADLKREHLPTRLITGVSFKADERVIVSTAIEKDILYKPTWRTGLEYNIYSKVFFRTGYALNPSWMFFGTGLHRRSLKIDYALAYNNNVGVTHQISACYIMHTKHQE